MEIKEGDRVRHIKDPDGMLVEVVRVDGGSVVVRDASGIRHPGVTWRIPMHYVQKAGE